MFAINVTTYFWASHQLTLPDGSDETMHQHNWKVTARVTAEKLDSMETVMDFHVLRDKMNAILKEIQGNNLQKNSFFQKNNSSAENVARYVYETLEPDLPRQVKLESVAVVEEPGCTAEFYK